MKPGIYTNISRAEYDNVFALNQSGMKALKVSPYHMKYDWDHRNEQDPTEAMLEGNAFDMMMFEPGKYNDTVLYIPLKYNKNGSISKQQCTSTYSKDGYIYMTSVNIKKLENMKKSLLKKKVIRNILSHGTPTVTLFWNDLETGIPCKARLDWLRQDDRFIADLKTCRDISDYGFTKQVAQLKYYYQAYWYVEGMKVLTGDDYLFWFLCAEKNKYYQSRRFKIPPAEFQKRGVDSDIRDLKLRFADCLASDKWPGYDDELEELYLPAYIEYD